MITLAVVSALFSSAMIGFLAIFLTFAPQARADQVTAASYVPRAELVGKARYRYLVWNVFDAHLFAPGGKYDPSKPFALTLTYLRDLKGSEIAKYSVDEIRAQGFTDESRLSLWQDEMARIFPDVGRNSQITGVRDKDGNAIFYSGGRRIGALNDPQFSRAFFDIWLGKRASDPSFRRSLTGS